MNKFNISDYIKMSIFFDTMQIYNQCSTKESAYDTKITLHHLETE